MRSGVFLVFFGFWDRVCRWLEAHHVGWTDSSTPQSHICLCMSRAQAENTGHPFTHSHMDCEDLLAPDPQTCTSFFFTEPSLSLSFQAFQIFWGVSWAHNYSLLWKDPDWWHSTSQTVIEKVLVKDLMDRQSVWICFELMGTNFSSHFHEWRFILRFMAIKKIFKNLGLLRKTSKIPIHKK